MPDFNVTRELAEELDTKGAIQLPEDLTPSGLMVVRLISNEYPLNSEKESLPPPEDYEHLDAWRVLRELFILGVGIEPGHISLECTPRPEPGESRGIHVDPFGQQLTMLFMMEPGEDDTLRTYSRGKSQPRPGSKPTTEFKYSAGPIVIAEKGYGLALAEDSEKAGERPKRRARDYSWHEGMGEVEAFIISFALHTSTTPHTSTA